MILMQHVRSAVQDRRGCKADHNKGEQTTETEAENKADGDKRKGNKTSDRQNRTEKRKVFSGDENRRRQTGEKTERNDAGFHDRRKITRRARRDKKQRHENY